MILSDIFCKSRVFIFQGLNIVHELGRSQPPTAGSRTDIFSVVASGTTTWKSGAFITLTSRWHIWCKDRFSDIQFRYAVFLFSIVMKSKESTYKFESAAFEGGVWDFLLILTDWIDPKNGKNVKNEKLPSALT